MKLSKVSGSVYANCDGETGGNVGLVEDGDHALAVDAQYPGSARRFREAIGEVTEKPLTHLLLTHVHGDHVFGNMVFEDLKIVAHEALKEKMERSLANEWAPGNLEKMLEAYRRESPERWWLFEGLRIVLPTETFRDRWSLGGVELIHMGGHTDCSSVVYVADDRTLFSGDLLFVGRFPWAGDPTADPDQWIRSLENILEMDVDVIVPGHGPPCDKDEVQRQIKWFKETRWIMRGLIEEGATEEEATAYDYPVLYRSDRPEWVKRNYSHWYRHWSRQPRATI
jgi:cyclase